MTESYQYQTFDDAQGLVDSYAKLRALHLPVLIGKSFLDVGCNEGYYCGVASRAGAGRVVGVDSFTLAIDRAKRRFPNVEFRLQTWDELPDEQFDIVLLASAMHYLESDDEIIALLTRIRRCLSNNGIFVLEAGVSGQPGNQLVEVTRLDGRVYYPTWEKLVYLINRAGLMWRKIAESEPGDGQSRIVMHCRKIQPVVMFVRGTSMSGKSYLSNSLASYDYWRILKLDSSLVHAFQCHSPEFQVNEADWPTTLDRAIATLPSEKLIAIADFVTSEIVKKSDLVGAHNLPRQDPVIVDGFDEEHSASEILFQFILRRLHELGYRVWDSRLLSAPIKDQWTMPDGLIDCGGFLLPTSSQAGTGDVLTTKFEQEFISCTIKVHLENGRAVGGFAMHAIGSVRNGIVVSETAPSTFEVRFPIKWLLKELGSNGPGKLEEAMRRGDVHFNAWTNDFRAFYLNRPIFADLELASAG
jgi:hypothetical protein